MHTYTYGTSVHKNNCSLLFSLLFSLFYLSSLLLFTHNMYLLSPYILLPTSLSILISPTFIIYSIYLSFISLSYFFSYKTSLYTFNNILHTIITFYILSILLLFISTPYVQHISSLIFLFNIFTNLLLIIFLIIFHFTLHISLSNHYFLNFSSSSILHHSFH